jgi:electron transfer flavoprotein alpha subunit
MTTHLIFVESDSNGIKKASLSALSAARLINGQIHGILLGKDTQKAATQLSEYVHSVHVASHEDLNHVLAKPYAKVISDVAKKINATHIWATATICGKDLMPRVAARLNAAMASDIQGVKSESIFLRPVWAGDLVCEIELLTSIKVISVRMSEFALADKLPIKASIENLDVSLDDIKTKFIGFDEVKSSRPNLSEASIVVSGGRGLKTPESFKQLIEPLADKLNAAIGASRAVCDAGWVPNDWQVGQTGKVVAPKLYIAIGISGAIQHVAGMKGSKVIVAINSDPEAPIFQIADYGLVASAFDAVPELIKLLG